MSDNFSKRLDAELFAGMLDLAAMASRSDAEAIKSGVSSPYGKEELIEFLSNLDNTFKNAAKAIRWALDNPNE